MRQSLPRRRRRRRPDPHEWQDRDALVRRGFRRSARDPATASSMPSVRTTKSAALPESTRARSTSPAHRRSRTQRLSLARRAGWSLLQPRAAVGWRADSGAQGLARIREQAEAHARGAVGAGHRRLVAVPVRGASDADGRRTQRCRTRHAGVRVVPLQPGISQSGRRRGAGNHAEHTEPPRRQPLRVRGRWRGSLHAEPNPTILYKTIGKLPQLSIEDQRNSTLQFYRELNPLRPDECPRCRRRGTQLP